MKAIPVNTPLLDGNELKYLSACIETGWISSEGPFIQQFEEQFSAYVERKHGIAVSSGSAALDIAVRVLNLGPGDEVIMPAFTIISPAQSVVRAGAKPILVDSDPLTWNMDVQQVEAKITSKTKAILVVHTYGLPVQMDSILSLAKKYNLKIIEDAAEVHGQTYKGKKCGSFGDISIFSFYANKIITTGEGGMIVTHDDELAERCRKLRNLAFEPGEKRFLHKEMGWNYRMTNMQAAIGLAQLEQIERHLELKIKQGNLYSQELGFLKEKGFQLPLAVLPYAQNIYWVFGLLATTTKQQKELVAHLKQYGIATRPFFSGIHQQPVFQELGLFKNESYPVTDKLSTCGFYLPGGLGLNGEQILSITGIIKEYFIGLV